MTELERKLCDMASVEWSPTWSSFLFNVEAVVSLGTPSDPTAIITAGEKWEGEGWTTSRASKVLYETTGVPLVSASVEDYKGSFLYSLALYWSLDVARFDLGERASDAAFALAGIFGAAAEGHGAVEEFEDDEDDSEDGSLVFPWEEKLLSLPKPLQVLWKRYGATSNSRFETKHLLEQAPRYEGLPTRAAENNVLGRLEQQSPLGKFDKLAKVTQQHLLNSLRVQTKLFTLLAGTEQATEATQLLQEHWAFTAAQVAKLDVERKESVLPGSAAQQEEVLFGNDEVKEVQSKRKVLELRRGIPRVSGAAAGPSCSFREHTRAAHRTGGKGYKGAGKGQGGRGYQGGWSQGGRPSSSNWSQGGKGFRSKGKGGRGKGLPAASYLPQASPPLCQGKAGQVGTDQSSSGRAASHQGRCAGRLAMSPSTAVAHGKEHIRGGKSAAAGGRLYRSRSSAGGTLEQQHSVSHSMVRFDKARAFRGPQASPDCRLSVAESAPVAAPVSAGKHSDGVSRSEKRHVWG
jgi:hypothetical protein